MDTLHKWIKKSGITSIELSMDDMACLVDRLVYDGKVIKIPRHSYQVMSDDSEDESNNNQEYLMWMFKATKYARDTPHLTNVPCGNCPVFEFCKEGGPVNPGECVYLTNWLAQDF